MEHDQEQIAAQLRQAFPDLPEFEGVRLVGEGFGSRVFLLDEWCIFRAAKSAEVGKRYEREFTFLRELKQSLPVAVPRPQWYSADVFSFGAIGYPAIDGVPFDLALAPRVDLPRVARDLADFMHALHSTPLAGFESSVEGDRDLEGVRDDTSPILRAYLPRARYDGLTSWWDSMLSTPTRPGSGGVVLHGDLWAENLILDDSLARLSGVVDFDGITVGDPARDFAPQLYLGKAFLERVVSRYVELGGRLGRHFEQRVSDELLIRELTGLQYALRQQMTDEMPDALRKIGDLAP